MSFIEQFEKFERFIVERLKKPKLQHIIILAYIIEEYKKNGDTKISDLHWSKMLGDNKWVLDLIKARILLHGAGHDYVTLSDPVKEEFLHIKVDSRNLDEVRKILNELVNEKLNEIETISSRKDDIEPNANTIIYNENETSNDEEKDQDSIFEDMFQ